MTRILIVEDQVMLRDSLSYAINTQLNLKVVSSVGDAKLAPVLVDQGGVDLVLMDVCTDNDSSGIVAAATIKEQHPQTKVVIMTGMPEITFIEQARNAGVDSFVYKNVGTDELVNVINATVCGGSVWPDSTPSLPGDATDFTQEEIDILRLVCQAKTRREIASELFMSEGTVKRKISEILAKTGYDSILRLAVHAVANGNIVPTINDKK